MSRYQPHSRERSPPRFSERRPSAPYAGPPGQNVYRSPNDPNPISVDRAPPRGPKADTFLPRGSYQYGPASRGRGSFTGRPDDWDRDRAPRDSRATSAAHRRDDERTEWPRRERDFNQPERGAIASRDSRSYVGRDRSASPARPRHDSKENAYSNFTRSTESSATYAPPVRGGTARGRGRGDWDRGRGRASFGGERDLFHPRSRSREAWRERDRDRDWPREADNERGDRFDRRETERSRDTEARGREYNSWQRDRSPSRQDFTNAAANVITPTTASTTLPGETPFSSHDRDRASLRRASVVSVQSSLVKDTRKDADVLESSNTEPPRRDVFAPRPFSPSAKPSLSTSASLDYGSPVPPPQNIPSTVTKQLATKVQTSKSEAHSAPQALFLPPTGPKAERAASNTGPNVLAPRTIVAEPWPKPETQVRTTRPSFAAVPGTPEQVSNRPNSSKENHERSQSLTERATTNAIPLGPRSGTSTVTKPRMPLSDSTSSSTPPLAPKSIPKPSIVDSRHAIPTGPRLDRGDRFDRGIAQWPVQDYKSGPPSRPSIMGAMNNKPYFADVRDRTPFGPVLGRPSFGYLNQTQRPRMFQPSIMNRQPDNRSALDNGSRRHSGATTMLRDDQRPTESDSNMADLDIPVNESSEDELDEEEEEEEAFGEEDFLDSEEKFRKEIKILESKKPASPLRDSSIVALLLRIQMLGMIACNAVPAAFEGAADQVDVTKQADVVPTGLPSPRRLSDEVASPPDGTYSTGRLLKDALIHPIPTPPIEDLPYLTKGVQPTFVTFEDSDDEVEQERMTTLARQGFEKAAWEKRDELEDLQSSYRGLFMSWKDDAVKLELDERVRATTPLPASPAPSVAPFIAPPLTQERTRGARNATELDVEFVIKMSEQSAREEEERRERENSKPNYETEARVPSMLDPTDTDMLYFLDTNRLIKPDIAPEAFAYIPPVDDFDDEEQKIFVKAFCQDPKKWGRIAGKLPGRTYQHCIAHYYLTKNEANYKESWRKSQPRKRRGRLPATQPGATNLLVPGYADDAEPLPMTDSGRPKRAAAPTFGDTNGDSETTPAPQSSRRMVIASRDANGEQVASKPSGRGRKTGTRVKRTKAQIAEDNRLAQLQLNGSDGSPQKLDVAGNRIAKSLLRASAVKTDPFNAYDTQRSQDLDPHVFAPVPTAEAALVSSLAGSTPGPGSQITSYWTVPEQQKFPMLIAYFGRDYHAIAEFMKTKSVTMIKNYYQRQLHDGKKELEEVAILAEEKRGRGETMGSPPTPVAPSKRRYEATPSLATSRRPIASALDAAIPEVEAMPPSMPSTLIDEFPPNSVQRGVRGDIIANKPRQVPELAPHTTLMPRQGLEDPDIDDKFALQPGRQSQGAGPPRGFFLEGGPENRAAQTQIHPHEQPLRHRPASRTLDLLQTENAQQRPSLLPNHTAQSQARDAPLQHSTTGRINHHPFIHTDNTAQPQLQGLLGHTRQKSSTSLVSPLQASLEHPPDVPFRRHEALRGLQYGAHRNLSPVQAPSQPSPTPRIDFARPSSTPVAPALDPPKPTPAKRSNIMSILNDDPPDPQPKRQSLEAPRTQRVQSPPPDAPLVRQNAVFQQARTQIPAEQMNDLLSQRNQDFGQQQLGRVQPTNHPVAAQVQQTTDYGGPHTSQLSRDQWLHRLDPRPSQGGGTLQSSSSHQSPAPAPHTSQYSVAPPPNSQSSSLPTLQRLHVDVPGRLDQNRLDLMPARHTALGQLNHPRIVPSPPPQQQVPQQAHMSSHQSQPYRSSSSSSQHGRVPSSGYGLGQQPQIQHPHQHQQQSQHQPPTPHSHSHSASSTSVPALHQHRSHNSTGFESRLSLQSHQQSQPSHEQQQQQQQQQQPPQPPRFSTMQAEDRHRREYELQGMQQQQQQMMAREQENRQRAEQEQRQRELIYQREQEIQQRMQQQQQGRSSIGGHNGPPPVNRTFTPPQGHQPGHSHNHSQGHARNHSHGHGMGIAPAPPGLGSNPGVGSGRGFYEGLGRDVQHQPQQKPLQAPPQQQQQQRPTGHYRQSSHGQPGQGQQGGLGEDRR